MKYELKIPAINGDVIPLCLVVEAMARAASTAYGKTPPHKPVFDHQLPAQTRHLLNEARAGRLHVCNQDGAQGTADEIIAAAKSSGDLSEVHRYLVEPDWEKLHRDNPPVVEGVGVWNFSGLDLGATETDWDTTNILCLYSKLHCLNEWGETRGDSFFISDEPVGWVDERGYMNPTDAPAAKGKTGTAITTHKLKTKNMPLDAEIATAKTRALDKTNVQSVWDADAQFILGLSYDNGDGVPKDAVKAVEWYQKAAEQGYADAQFNLGLRYANGEGVPKDAVKAVEWYQKAAAQGDVDAQLNLGNMYGKGEGIPKDAAKAVEWYQKAAAQGYAAAQFNLGNRYANGEGVPKDAAKAVEWYQKAAAQGYAKAQNNLGVMYDNGEGVSKNMVRAYAWWNLAAAQGDDSAIKNRDSIEKHLTATQRAEGQQLASNWRKGDTLQAAGDNPYANPKGGSFYRHMCFA